MAVDQQGKGEADRQLRRDGNTREKRKRRPGVPMLRPKPESGESDQGNTPGGEHELCPEEHHDGAPAGGHGKGADRK